MFVKLFVVVLVVAFAVGLAARSTHGAGPERHYVVKPADTLWAIAERSYAGDVREGVWKLEQRNNLTSATLRPGQVLVLPG
jgi:LysM repeat protein